MKQIKSLKKDIKSIMTYFELLEKEKNIVKKCYFYSLIYMTKRRIQKKLDTITNILRCQIIKESYIQDSITIELN